MAGAGDGRGAPGHCPAALSELWKDQRQPEEESNKFLQFLSIFRHIKRLMGCGDYEPGQEC